ncbi:hypothetical protein [Fischerella sp.]|nr:hypothetical protein [Fischerella sp.]
MQACVFVRSLLIESMLIEGAIALVFWLLIAETRKRISVGVKYP